MPTILKGLSVGALGSEFYNGNTETIAYALEAGNSVEVQRQVELNAVLEGVTREIPVVDGMPIPVETYNAFFSKGGISTDAPEFNQTYEAFIIRESQGFNAMAFSHSLEEVLKAKARGIDLVKRDLEAVEALQKVYVNKYLPNTKLVALLTGNSSSVTCPVESNGGKYVNGFGALRGERVADFLPSTAENVVVNHYRGTKGTSVASEDITDLADSIEEFEKYSGKGIGAFVHPRTLSNLGKLYGDTLNSDRHVIDGVKTETFLGITWIPVSRMHKDIIVLFDLGQPDLIFRFVSPDAEQRGMGIVTAKNLEKFHALEDLDGAKLRIFEEEYMVLNRHAVGILDIATQGQTANGKEGWATPATITKIEAFAKKLMEGYTR